MSDKPWEEVPATVWRFFTRGYRKLFTVPMFLLFSLVIALPDTTTKLRRSFNFIRDTLYPTTFLTRFEYDVRNEWVAVIWSYQDVEEAKKEVELFKKAYAESGHSIWNDDILLVRDPERSQTWQIVMDLDYGKSEQGTIQARLDELKEFGNKTRHVRNSFGHWLDTATVQLYDLEKFEVTHGKAKNIVKGMSSLR